MWAIDIWGIYEAIQTYRGCINIQGAYRCMGCIQKYRSIQMYGGCTDVWGCTHVGGLIDIPKQTESQIYICTLA